MKSQWDKDPEEREDPQQPTQTQPVCSLTHGTSYEWKEIVSWKKKNKTKQNKKKLFKKH